MEGGDHGHEVQANLELNFKDFLKLVGVDTTPNLHHVSFLVKMGKCFSAANVNIPADGCYSKAFTMMTNICRDFPLEENLHAFETICSEGAELAAKTGKEKGAKIAYAIAEGLKYLRTQRKREAEKARKEDHSNLSPEEKESLRKEERIQDFANILAKYWSGALSDEELQQRAIDMGGLYSEFEDIAKKRAY